MSMHIGEQVSNQETTHYRNATVGAGNEAVVKKFCLGLFLDTIGNTAYLTIRGLALRPLVFIARIAVAVFSLPTLNQEYIASKWKLAGMSFIRILSAPLQIATQTIVSLGRTFTPTSRGVDLSSKSWVLLSKVLYAVHAMDRYGDKSRGPPRT